MISSEGWTTHLRKVLHPDPHNGGERICCPKPVIFDTLQEKGFFTRRKTGWRSAEKNPSADLFAHL